MDRGAWWARVRGIAESDMTVTNTHKPRYSIKSQRWRALGEVGNSFTALPGKWSTAG